MLAHPHCTKLAAVGAAGKYLIFGGILRRSNARPKANATLALRR